MKAKALVLTAICVLVAAGTAQAAPQTYNVTTTFFEPMTQPRDSIFQGSFSYDSATQSFSGLSGTLTESMTGMMSGVMTTVPLTYNLAMAADGFGGELISLFYLNTTDVFDGGGFATGGTHNTTYFGSSAGALNPKAGGIGNAFITFDINLADPLAALSAAQISLLAYGDCTSGGMMGATCMTGISGAGGGTMMGYPVSQTVTAAVPEPGSWALMIAGLGAMGFITRRRGLTA